MKPIKIFSLIGMMVILVTGLIHLYNAPGEFQDAQYLAVLFFAFFLGSIVSAIVIYRDELLWGWALEGLLAIGAISGF